MKGDPDVVKRLNHLLGHELASSELYLAQSRVLDDQGYKKIAARLRHESDDERTHAEKLMERIVYLEGTIDLSQRPNLSILSDAKSMFEADLSYELDVRRLLNETIELSTGKLDAGTRMVLDELLKDTEMDHINWLESQLKMIGDIGIQKYLAEQM